MYTPQHFDESRSGALHALMRTYPLAALVTHSTDGLDAQHIPLLLRESGPLGVLQGHVARANLVWKTVGDDRDVLAIFQGPNHYVSPNWYPSKKEHGQAVPTWNYLAVHARGSIRWQHDAAWLREHLEAATTTHETSDRPWRIADAPAEYLERRLRAIVGFEIRITELQGKWKLSQNRSADDRQGVIDALKAAPGAMAAEVLCWMQREDDAS